MAVTTICGYEAGAGGPDNLTLTGSAAYSTTQHRTGDRSISVNVASGNNGAITYATGSGSDWLHFGIYVVTLPSLDRIIAGAISFGINLRITSTGTIKVYNDTTLIGTSSTALGLNTWYWIGRRGKTGTSVQWLQIDEVDQVTGTATVAAQLTAIGANGSEASAMELYLDDFIIDDAGFLASSNVNLALPISDNTVTGVTDNNGVTTNIWQCVDNIPPAGVASANEAANPKAGMHFPASVTCNYIANLETYTTLGVGASDTVLAVQSIVRQGEDIATGTKNLQNVGALTNPTVAGASVVAGGDAGAHAAEVGLWVTTLGTMTTSPSVTLGTSPTIRTSRTSESRLACVDFMGMYVAWTPGTPAADQPFVSPQYKALLAQ